MSVYIIRAARAHSKPENIDSARDRIEAEYLVQEYALAYGPAFRISYIAAHGKAYQKKHNGK